MDFIKNQFKGRALASWAVAGLVFGVMLWRDQQQPPKRIVIAREEQVSDKQSSDNSQQRKQD